MASAGEPVPHSHHMSVQHLTLQEWKQQGATTVRHFPGVVNPSGTLARPLGWLLLGTPTTWQGAIIALFLLQLDPCVFALDCICCICTLFALFLLSSARAGEDGGTHLLFSVLGSVCL